MARKALGSIYPGVRKTGLPETIELSHAAGVTAATQKLDFCTFETANLTPGVIDDSREDQSQVFGAHSIEARAESLGTGGTSGNWTIALQQNGTTVASVNIAYNATTLDAFADVRDATGNPIYFNRFDVITLAVTAIPAGTLSGGIQGLKLRVRGVSFGRRTW